MTLAIIAGRGDLPRALHAARPDAQFVTITGVGVMPPEGANHIEASFEKIGKLFDAFRKTGVTQVVFAGGIERPSLNPARFDFKMVRLMPRLASAFRSGDDALLRTVIGIFEDEGLKVRGAHEIAPDLLAAPGWRTGAKLTKALQSDAARAAQILQVLSPMDVGQAAVVSGGHCLGIETLQGTDAMLEFVASSRSGHTGGVLVKLPKSGQEMRVDMPTIGTQTLTKAHAAGLKGIMVAEGATLVLDRARVEDMANDLGLTLWAGAVS